MVSVEKKITSADLRDPTVIKTERDQRVLDNHNAINVEQLRLEAELERTGDPALFLAAINEIIETNEESREQLRQNLEDLVLSSSAVHRPKREPEVRPIIKVDTKEVCPKVHG